MPHIDTVGLGIWASVGARDDPPSMAGMAHALEHMVFKGTKTRSARQIVEEIEVLGGQCNAYTGREISAFHVRMLADDWPQGLEILHDMLWHSEFDAQAWNLERDVICEEIAQSQDTPDDHIFDILQHTSFHDHALGRPILGTPQDLQRITPKDFHDFIKARYTPERVVVAISGRVDPDVFLQKCRVLFGNIPAHDATLMRDKPHYVGGTTHEARDLQQTHMLVALHAHSMDEDYYPLLLLNEILGGGMTSRLFQTIREEKGSAYSIYSYVDLYDDARMLGIYAGTNDPGTVLDDIVAIIQTLHDTMTEDELARAKQQFRAGLSMGLESPLGRCEFYIRHLLRFGHMPDRAKILRDIDAIHLRDLQAALSGLLHDRPSCVSLGCAFNSCAIDGLGA
ncbi:MAG: pitrilysin family protein [Pseudomonadota bacterium]